MELISFVLMVLASIGAFTMLGSSCVTPSPMQSIAIGLTLIIFLLTLIGVRITYKEMKEGFNK